MAGTWELQITPLDAARKEAQVIALRTDTSTGQTRTYVIASAILDTAAQKNAAVDQIWAMYQAELAQEVAVAAYVGNLAAQGKAALEAKEPA